MATTVKEGYPMLRLALVVWSLSPVFLVWAVRGSAILDQSFLNLFAGLTLLGPLAMFRWRLMHTKKSKLEDGGNLQELTVRRLTDRREHLLSYLFPLLLSFWAIDFQDFRELASFGCVMLFTGLAFWHLQLTYVNLWLALVGYRSVQVEPKGASGRSLRPIILLTKNHRLQEGEFVQAWLLTNNLYIEKPEK